MDFKKNILLLLIIIISPFVITSLNTTDAICQSLKKPEYFPSPANKDQIEVDEIKFLGNKGFSDEELMSRISSKPTYRSWPHQILEYYYNQIKSSPKLERLPPRMFTSTLSNGVNTMLIELQFWDQSKAEADVQTLIEFYNQNGYHDANVSYDFSPDTAKKINVLTFTIKEDSLYSIKNIVYEGLDSLPLFLIESITRARKVLPGHPFNEDRIINEMQTILKLLLDNGYYYARFDVPIVTKDSVNYLDSVYIAFNTGKRQKIESIDFIDSAKGQKIVSIGMKKLQLEFEPGDWYSLNKINRSINNLMSIGTFDITSIDTSTIFHPKTDTSLPFLVFNQYRKQNEASISPYINKTTIDNFTNIGVEGSYLDRNVWGIGQSINLFAKVEMQDISRGTNADLLYQAGINYAQPLLWVIDAARIGLAAQLVYTESYINTDLKIRTLSFAPKLPFRLPEFTYFQNGSIDVLVEWQIPVDINKAIAKSLINSFTNLENKKNIAIKDAKNTGGDTMKIINDYIIYEKDDSTKIQSNYKIYKTLDKFYTGGQYGPSAVIIGGTIIGDKRDNIFSPTKGYYFNLSTDGTPLFGIAKFFRLQANYYYFFSINNNAVFALKLRGGYTNWWNRDNSYIPIERQFFAGGANSVRGWSSRRLRYPEPQNSDSKSTISDFFQDYFGSLVIIEGSIEYRYRLSRPHNMSALIADQIANIGFTFFFDFGNTFNWIIDDTYTYKWSDYITKLAVGTGFGINYQTPVGPFRIDLAWPFYDPSAPTAQTIFTRYNVLKDTKFNIGLGYAF